MASEIILRDQNFVTVLSGITNDSGQEIRMLRVDPVTGRLLVSATGGSNSLVVGTTTITSGTTTRILYDNAGVLGEYTLTGTGTVVVMQNTPTLTTPVLGIASATSINKIAITAPATSATLTIDDGFTLHVTGNVTALSGSSTGTNTGDQTSIVGITGTKAQFNTACSDGNFLFVGDVASPILSVGGTFDGAGGVVATNSVLYFTIPYAGTIVGWSIMAVGSSPTCTIDVWNLATGTTALPTVANTIMGTKPALSAGNTVYSTTLTGWDTAIVANDKIGINVDAVSVATNIVFQIFIQPS